jgi:pimeloyl-ACP methyl ester carboxylesterase
LLVAIVLALSAALLVGARTLARAYVFPTGEVPTVDAPPDVVVHSLRALDGTPVRVLELTAGPEARVIVDFHNNRETAESRVELGRALRARGFDVILVEYRGYGGSRAGQPTEGGLYQDAEAALDMLAGRGVGPERVTLLGTSLGTGVAAEMARRGRCSRLVLVSPYTSIPDLVSNAAPFLPAGALVPDHFDTLGKSSFIHVPTLVIHGDDDDVIPFVMGERLSRAIEGATLLRVRGGHHGDLFARDGDRLLSEIGRLGSVR